MAKKKEQEICPTCKSTKISEFSRGGMGAGRWHTYIECNVCKECGILFISQHTLKE